MPEAMTARRLSDPQEYYASLGGDRNPLTCLLKDKFHDIDDKANFDHFMSRLQSPLMENFVLDFGNEDAWCATNLNEDELKRLLSRSVCQHPPTRASILNDALQRPKCFGTRWM